MIIENGTIEVKKKTVAGAVDPETGHAVKPSKASWGRPVPCQYTASRNRLAKTQQGEPFTQASYEILIEEQPFVAEQVRLRDRRGSQVGDYSVKQIEPLEAVGQLRIIV